MDTSLKPMRRVERSGCLVELRCFDGARAREFFLTAKPGAEVLRDHGEQAAKLLAAAQAVLKEEGGESCSILRETWFGLEGATLLSSSSSPSPSPASYGARARFQIGQPPLTCGALVELAIHAIAFPSDTRAEPVPGIAPTDWRSLAGESGQDALGIALHLGEESRFYASGLGGAGASAYDQALSCFERAEALLEANGFTFHDVARTWIHLREIDRDYADLNRARRDFFDARGIDPVPASTGIGGAPANEERLLTLGVHAVRGPGASPSVVMKTTTLNEAGSYGADFSRGMRCAGENGVALYVSGTASIDEAGRTVHLKDLEGQVARMLRNVETLLAGQGAHFEDLASAITYVKYPEDAARVLALCEAAGYSGFPHTLVEAAVCRPELLCETEAIALLRADSPPESLD